jgi:hypothetical protein
MDSRATQDKKLNRSAAKETAKESGKKPSVTGGESKQKKGQDPKTEQALDKDRDYKKVGLVPGAQYQFVDSKKSVSRVRVQSNSATFCDTADRPYVTLSYSALAEVLSTLGDVFYLQNAPKTFPTSSAFRNALVLHYYNIFRPGNKLAKNGVGSGQFRYEVSLQHLTDSISNELHHVFWKLGLKALEGVAAQYADANPGMECWGTSMQIVLKARGLVPPTMTRTEFESTYSSILKALPDDLQRTMFGSLKGLGRAGVTGAARTLRILASSLAKREWASLTGMDKVPHGTQILETAGEIEAEVKSGNVVFVGVPGHFKVAVGGASSSFAYDDPLGFWGHILYDKPPPKFGIALK